MKKAINLICLCLFVIITTLVLNPYSAWSAAPVGKKAKTTRSAITPQSGSGQADLASELNNQI
ncbi:MAG: hypothetical protein WCK85_10930 [Chlorobium sp.]